MPECAGAAQQRAALIAEILSTIASGIHLVTSVPLPGQLNPEAVATGVRAAAAHPAVRLTAIDFGSCAAATRAFRDALRWAVAGVLPPGRAVIHPDPRLLERFPATAAYFTCCRNPAADGFILPARDLGLTVITEPTPANLRAHIERRAQAMADAEALARHHPLALADGPTDHPSNVWDLRPGPLEVGFDLGYGVGRVERLLAPSVREVHLVTPAEALLAEARQLLADLPNVFFHRNNGYDLLPLPSGGFDFGFADLIFQLVSAPVIEGYVAEIWRVLKPGGRFTCNILRKDGYESPDPTGRLSGGMTEDEVRRLFARFSRVELLPGGEASIVPVAVK